MKMRINRLVLYSALVNKKIHFVLISDIHSDANKLEKVYKVIDDINPSFIAIPGDTLDYIDDRRNIIVKQMIEYQSKKYPTFISKGNHDTLASKQIKNNVDGDVFNYISFFDDLDKSNITVFDNNYSGISVDNNTYVYGMELPDEWYQNGENRGLLIDRLASYTFNPESLNILLFHSPYPFVRKDGNLIFINEANFLPDLILTGHTHGGLVPYCLKKIIPENRGLIGPCPNKRILPRNSYGIYNSDNSSLIISDGITKIHYSGGGRLIAPIGDLVFIPDIYVIDIVPTKKKEEKKLIRLNTSIVNK